MADAPSAWTLYITQGVFSDNCRGCIYIFLHGFLSILLLPILTCPISYLTCSTSAIFKLPAQPPIVSMPYPKPDRSHRPSNWFYPHGPWNQVPISNASRSPTEGWSTGTVPTPPSPFNPLAETWSTTSSLPSRSSSRLAQGSLQVPRAPHQSLPQRPTPPPSVWMRPSAWERPSSRPAPSDDRFLPPYLRHESTKLVPLPD